MNHEVPDPAPATARGTLVLAPNPCTTEPCLPAMALAIDVGGELCFITRQGAWLTDASALGASWLAVGEVIVASGTIADAADVHGDIFRAIEITSIERA